MRSAARDCTSRASLSLRAPMGSAGSVRRPTLCGLRVGGLTCSQVGVGSALCPRRPAPRPVSHAGLDPALLRHRPAPQPILSRPHPDHLPRPEKACLELGRGLLAGAFRAGVAPDGHGRPADSQGPTEGPGLGQVGPQGGQTGKPVEPCRNTIPIRTLIMLERCRVNMG